MICADCHDNFGTKVAAVFSAPIGGSNGYVYIPVCHDHANGWYDGADFSETDAPLITLA